MAESGVNRRTTRRGRSGWGQVRSANRLRADVDQLALTVDGDDSFASPCTSHVVPPQPQTPPRRAAVDAASATSGPEVKEGHRAAGADATQPDTGGAVEPPLVLTVAQLEDALQLGRTRTYELIRSGEIPVLRVGRLIRVSRAALEQWIAERSLSTAADASLHPSRRR